MASEPTGGGGQAQVCRGVLGNIDFPQCREASQAIYSKLLETWQTSRSSVRSGYLGHLWYGRHGFHRPTIGGAESFRRDLGRTKGNHSQHVDVNRPEHQTRRIDYVGDRWRVAEEEHPLPGGMYYVTMHLQCVQRGRRGGKLLFEKTRVKFVGTPSTHAEILGPTQSSMAGRGVRMC